MSEPTPEPHHENGNRATVALVDAKVATVDAKIDGLTELLRVELKDIGRRLEDVGRMGVKVDGHNDRILMLEARATDLEQWQKAELTNDERRKNYRSVHLPSLLLALIAVAVAIAVPLFINSPK